MLTRRASLLGLATGLFTAAPAIVNASSLMKIKPIRPLTNEELAYAYDDIKNSYKLVERRIFWIDLDKNLIYRGVAFDKFKVCFDVVDQRMLLVEKGPCNVVTSKSISLARF